MAQIDVSELLSDPDFINYCTIIRRTTSVGSDGLNTLVESQIATVGSVQPLSGRDLMRIPEALRMADVRTFWLKLEIVKDAANDYPDILVFNGHRYQIQKTTSWMNWGAGWNEGLCVKEKPS